MQDNKDVFSLIGKVVHAGAWWKVIALVAFATVIGLSAAIAYISTAPKPVHIVSGAKPGIYAPAESMEDIVRDVAENFILLNATVTSDTVDGITKRAGKYLAPSFRARYLDDMRVLGDSIRTSDATIVFSPDSSSVLSKINDTTYAVSMKGTREYFAGSVSKDRKVEKYVYEVTMERTRPTEMNVYGYHIIDIKKGRPQS